MIKRFYRTSIGSILFQIITILGLLLDVYFCIESIKSMILNGLTGDYWIGIFVALIYCLGIPILVYIELTFLVGNISLNSRAISTIGDIKFKREKIQYPTSIDYSDISEITIVGLRKNSKGGCIKLSRPVPFLVLKNKNGKESRFGLYFMSNKTVNSLLIELLDRCKNNNGIQFDVDILMKNFSLAKFSIKEK